MDQLYGVVVCGVLDERNLTFPRLYGGQQGITPKAERIYIPSYS